MVTTVHKRIYRQLKYKWNLIFFSYLDPTAWTYNRLLRPDAPKSSLSSISLSDDEGNGHHSPRPSITSSIIVINKNFNNNDYSKDVDTAGSTATSLTSPTLISVGQFLSEFPRKFPNTFEREFEVSIRPIGGSFSASAVSSIVNGNSPAATMTSTNRFSDRANYAKNRYVDVPCLDHSAVILPGDGYIHANYVDGYKKRKAYILTQGKLLKNVEVWERLNIICSQNRTVLTLISNPFPTFFIQL